MARRSKKPLVAVEPVAPTRPSVPVEGPVYVDGYLYLAKSDLQLLEIAHLRNSKALQYKELLELKATQVKSEELQKLKAIPGMTGSILDAVLSIQAETAGKLSSIKADQGTNARELVLTHNALLDVLKAIEFSYKQDLTKVTYDENTGLIHVDQSLILSP